MQQVLDLWSVPGAVNGGFAAIAAQPASPVDELISRNCAMVRQSSRFAAELPEAVLLSGDAGHIGWFSFPGGSEDAAVIITGGMAAALDATPPTQALLSFMGSSEFANARQVAERAAVGGALSGFTTGNSGVDRELWSDSGADFNEFLSQLDAVQFDASATMPSEVQDTLSAQETALLSGGTSTVDAAVLIDAARPLRSN